MSRRQMADLDDPIFVQLKNVVNSVIEQFEQQRNNQNWRN